MKAPGWSQLFAMAAILAAAGVLFTWVSTDKIARQMKKDVTATRQAVSDVDSAIVAQNKNEFDLGVVVAETSRIVDSLAAVRIMKQDREIRLMKKRLAMSDSSRSKDYRELKRALEAQARSIQQLRLQGR